MEKYRIVEEKGLKTNRTVYYVQKRVRKLFGGYKWIYKYEYHPQIGRRRVEFNTFKEAKEWLEYYTEDVYVEYYNYI